MHPNRFVQVPDQFDAFIRPKKAKEKKAKISLRHLLVNLKNVLVLAPPMLITGLWRQCQPLVVPRIQYFDGALRSVKHERRNVVVRVRGCRMTRIQEYIFGMQAQQGVLWSELLVVQKR